ncbi:hypothetical protein PLICRDRAFT_179239 [Plicaturopsis crispa FD-325 SS-3]|uniref:Uncharacterized protein n=1 Tax=Plicaturopsis crispa FD-325 SS-3 TaxID=944288 RepID=A0A0C9T9H7_PLICR|nr:hypothetical protein PLICRDRAFT_179239 [Plicaturopsis crispa FD-325 SS-3]
MDLNSTWWPFVSASESLPVDRVSAAHSTSKDSSPTRYHSFDSDLYSQSIEDDSQHHSFDSEGAYAAVVDSSTPILTSYSPHYLDPYALVDTPAAIPWSALNIEDSGRLDDSGTRPLSAKSRLGPISVPTRQVQSFSADMDALSSISGNNGVAGSTLGADWPTDRTPRVHENDSGSTQERLSVERHMEPIYSPRNDQYGDDSCSEDSDDTDCEHEHALGHAPDGDFVYQLHRRLLKVFEEHRGQREVHELCLDEYSDNKAEDRWDPVPKERAPMSSCTQDTRVNDRLQADWIIPKQVPPSHLQRPMDPSQDMSMDPATQNLHSATPVVNDTWRINMRMALTIDQGTVIASSSSSSQPLPPPFGADSASAPLPVNSIPMDCEQVFPASPDSKRKRVPLEDITSANTPSSKRAKIADLVNNHIRLQAKTSNKKGITRVVQEPWKKSLSKRVSQSSENASYELDRNAYMNANRRDVGKPSLTKSASLRKAMSLRPEAKDWPPPSVTQIEEGKSESANVAHRAFAIPSASVDGSYCAPTEPTTPADLTRPKSCHPLANSLNYLPPSPPSPCSSPVPIIAPPPFELIPRAPVYPAEARLAVLLDREQAWREKELGVAPRGDEDVDADSDDENDYEYLDADGEWAIDEGRLNKAIERDDKIRAQLFPDLTVSGANSNGLRKEVLEWILDVVPQDPASARHLSLSPDLYDQLMFSSDTRFHAAYMFIRYFHLVARSTLSANAAPVGECERDARLSSGDTSMTSSQEQHLAVEGEDIVAWDVAVATIALSVKYNRDVLPPLSLIFASDFLTLLQQSTHRMSLGDLEQTQRDVIGALQWDLAGPGTPQAFMDELWEALPSLQALLDGASTRKMVEEEAWGSLLWAVLEPDVTRFPISLLTTVAFMDGLTSTHARQLKSKAQGCVCSAPTMDVSHVEDKWMRRAGRATAGAMKDVQELLCVTDTALAICQEWWASAQG